MPQGRGIHGREPRWKSMKRPVRPLARAGLSTIGPVQSLLLADPGWRESLMSTLQPSTSPATPLVVEPGSFLTLHYRMAAPGGASIINTFEGKPATLSLGNGELSPAIEQRLLGLPEGTRTTFQLAAGEAFGERNPELVQSVSRATLDENSVPGADYKIGDLVDFAAPGGGRFAGVLREMRDDSALFDFNHPLAGQPLRFEVQLISVL